MFINKMCVLQVVFSALLIVAAARPGDLGWGGLGAWGVASPVAWGVPTASAWGVPTATAWGGVSTGAILAGPQVIAHPSITFKI